VEQDFVPRHALDRSPLLELFAWDKATFLARTEGSALRRINYRQWQRNVAVALGNAPYDPAIVDMLAARRAMLDPDKDGMVIAHVDWALQQQRERGPKG
jgi:epoxyqueuosine reductase